MKATSGFTVQGWGPLEVMVGRVDSGFMVCLTIVGMPERELEDGKEGEM